MKKLIVFLGFLMLLHKVLEIFFAGTFDLNAFLHLPSSGVSWKIMASLEWLVICSGMYVLHLETLGKEVKQKQS